MYTYTHARTHVQPYWCLVQGSLSSLLGMGCIWEPPQSPWLVEGTVIENHEVFQSSETYTLNPAPSMLYKILAIISLSAYLASPPAGRCAGFQSVGTERSVSAAASRQVTAARPRRPPAREHGCWMLAPHTTKTRGRLLWPPLGRGRQMSEERSPRGTEGLRQSKPGDSDGPFTILLTHQGVGRTWSASLPRSVLRKLRPLRVPS